MYLNIKQLLPIFLFFNRQEKRYLAKHQIKRDQISRESQYDREKRLRKELSIARTKKMKVKIEQLQSGQSEIVQNESNENSVETKSSVQEKKLKSERKKIVNFKTSKISKSKKMKAKK
jgi:hypothetical protein